MVWLPHGVGGSWKEPDQWCGLNLGEEINQWRVPSLEWEGLGKSQPMVWLQLGGGTEEEPDQWRGFSFGWEGLGKSSANDVASTWGKRSTNGVSPLWRWVTLSPIG